MEKVVSIRAREIERWFKTFGNYEPGKKPKVKGSPEVMEAFELLWAEYEAEAKKTK